MIRRESELQVEALTPTWTRFTAIYETAEAGQRNLRALGLDAERHMLIWSCRILSAYLRSNGLSVLAATIEQVGVEVMRDLGRPVDHGGEN